MTKSIQPIHIVCGATATGKSAHALSLAEKLGGVIINADSQQLYRDLPILTARPTPQDEARVPHKLYGILGADETASAGKWLKFAKMEIDWVLAQNQTPIVVGGTGLYIRALMEGLAEIPEIPPAVRAQSESDFEAMGKDAFAERLHAVDPEFFERLKVHDRQRLIRAYAVWLGTGNSLSWWQRQKVTPFYPKESFHITKVELPRDTLYQRCDQRFLAMIGQGAVDEVRALFSSPWKGEDQDGGPVDTGSMVQNASRADPHPTLPLPGGGQLGKIIGVPELSAYIRKEISLDAAIEKAQQATRNYAKRQMTWFRNQL